MFSKHRKSSLCALDVGQSTESLGTSLQLMVNILNLLTFFRTKFVEFENEFNEMLVFFWNLVVALISCLYATETAYVCAGLTPA